MDSIPGFWRLQLFPGVYPVGPSLSYPVRDNGRTMNRVVNASKATQWRGLCEQVRRFRAGRSARRTALVLPSFSRLFPHDFFAASVLDLCLQVVDNQRPDFLAIYVPRMTGWRSPEGGDPWLAISSEPGGRPS